LHLSAYILFNFVQIASEAVLNTLHHVRVEVCHAAFVDQISQPCAVTITGKETVMLCAAVRRIEWQRQMRNVALAFIESGDQLNAVRNELNWISSAIEPCKLERRSINFGKPVRLLLLVDIQLQHPGPGICGNNPNPRHIPFSPGDTLTERLERHLTV